MFHIITYAQSDLYRPDSRERYNNGAVREMRREL
jgi:hypothetical protein